MAFESLDEEVLTVSGRSVLAVGSGETEVRAFHPPSGEESGDPAVVTVPEITALSIQPASSTVQVGSTVQLRALAVLETGRTGVDVTAVVEWESGKRDVASVVAGLVRGLAEGDAEIKAEDPSSGVKSPKNGAFVHVVPGGGGDPDDEIVRMWVEPTELSMLPGEATTLRVSALLEGGATVDVTADVSYESTRSPVASVNGVGRVTAVAEGTSRIRIEHPTGAEVEEEPEVWVGELEQIHLSPQTRSLAIGDTLALQAIGSFDNGRSLDLTEQVAWFTDEASVLAVSNTEGTRGRVVGVAAGEAVISARHRDTGVESRRSEGEFVVGAGGAGEPPPVEGSIRDLVFEPPVLRIRPGQSETLRVFAVYSDGGTRDLTDRVELKVRDSRVAEIEEGAVVTALAGGQTEILAFDPISRARAGVRARIEVTRLIALRIDPATASIPLGETRQLRARADFDDGSTGVDVTSLVSWTSSKTDVATVGDGASKGLVAAVAEGNAEIRAEDPVSGLRSDRTSGRVSTGGATSEPGTDLVEIAFEPALLELAKDESSSVEIFGVRSDGTREALSLESVRLRSLERRVVTVGRDGAILGRRGGVGDVLAEHEASGATGTLPVTVREISQVDISPAAISLRVGDVVDLTAMGRFNDGSEAVPLTADVQWRSSSTNVATVEAIGGKGRVTAIEPGVAFLQARHRTSRASSDSSTGQVQVLGELERIIVEPASTVLDVGDFRQLRAVGQFSEGGIMDLTDEVVWDVSNRSVARVSISGRLQALANGEARVAAIDVRTGRSSTENDGDAVVTVGAVLTGLQVSTSPDELSASPVQVRLTPGEAIQLYALGAHAGATKPSDRSDVVDWLSSDPAIVTVEDGGIASCVAVGAAVISATDSAANIRSTDTLGDATVVCGDGIGVLQVDPDETALDYPRSRQMRAFRVFEDGSQTEVTRSVLWTSSDPEAVSVVESGGDAGVVTALDDGAATISVVDPAFGASSNDPGGVNGVVTVRKTRVELEIFPIYPLPDPDGVHRGTVGEVLRLRARVRYASGATQGVNLRVEWTSSNAGVVLMGTAAGLEINQGLMLAPGRTTITARWPADEFSPELTASIEVEVRPLP